MDEVFSAHVTGNFVIFAAAIAQGVEQQDYLKIVTFPVFLLAVALGTLLYRVWGKGKNNPTKYLLWPMTFIFLGCALTTSILYVMSGNPDLGKVDIAVTLLIVLALGLQNTLHHFIAGPLTTVMTGTVMNTTASLIEKYVLRIEKTAQVKSFKPISIPVLIIIIFALGCVIAAFITTQVGLASISLPTLLMFYVLFLERTNIQETSFNQ
jgi:uncharacterized membrane protein YoaK (UPF0700 family)